MSADQVGEKGAIGLWAAVSLGVGAMVGAGIFAVFGQVAAIAGGATYISFILGGVVAGLTGYSFARLGARYPSAGGPVEYLVQGFGRGLFSGGLSILYVFSLIIVLALLTRALGAYAAALFVPDGREIWVNVFASLGILVLAFVNFVGAQLVGRVETAIVVFKVSILVMFAALGLITLNPDLLSTSTYSPTGDIFFAIALTYFAFGGFTIINNAAEDMSNPAVTLPRAVLIAIGFVLVLYVAVSFAVFGNLTVSEVIADQDTALAEAAKPILGNAGFVIMAIAALVSTASSILATLYGVLNMTYSQARDGELPPMFSRRVWRSGTEGLFFSVVLILLLANLLSLERIASLGSLALLMVYVAVTYGHLRLSGETGASRPIIWIGLLANVAVVLLFLVYLFDTNANVIGILVFFIVASFVTEYLLQRYRRDAIQPRITT